MPGSRTLLLEDIKSTVIHTIARHNNIIKFLYFDQLLHIVTVLEWLSIIRPTKRLQHA